MKSHVPKVARKTSHTHPTQKEDEKVGIGLMPPQLTLQASSPPAEAGTRFQSASGGARTYTGDLNRQTSGVHTQGTTQPSGNMPIQAYKTSAGWFSNKVEFESSGFSAAMAGGLDIQKTGTDLDISSKAYTAQGTVKATGPKGRVKEFELGFLQTVYDSKRHFYYQPDPYNPGILEQIGTAIAPQIFSDRLKRTDLCDPLPVRDGDAGFVPWYGPETVHAFDEAATSTKTADMYDKPSSSSPWEKTVGGKKQYLVKTSGQDVFRSWLSVQEKGTTGFMGMHRMGYADWKVDYSTSVAVNKASPASSVVTPGSDSGGKVTKVSGGFGAYIPLMGDPVANDAAKWVESNW